MPSSAAKKSYSVRSDPLPSADCTLATTAAIGIGPPSGPLTRKPLVALVANLSYRNNLLQSRNNCGRFLAVQRRLNSADDRQSERNTELPHSPRAICATSQSSMANA